MVAVVRWDPAGRHLFSWGIEGNLKSWQLGERLVSDVLTGQEAFGFALSPDGRWLAFGGGEMHTGRLTPDGRLLAELLSPDSSGKETVAVVEVLTGKRIAETELLAAPFGPRTFSRDGAWLVTLDVPQSCRGRCSRIWKATSQLRQTRH